METQFEDKGKSFVLLSRVSPGKLLTIDKSVLIRCTGKCNGTSNDCKMIIPIAKAAKPVIPVCNCNTGCRLIFIEFPLGGNGLDNSEEMFIGDEK